MGKAFDDESSLVDRIKSRFQRSNALDRNTQRTSLPLSNPPFTGRVPEDGSIPQPRPATTGLHTGSSSSGDATTVAADDTSSARPAAPPPPQDHKEAGTQSPAVGSVDQSTKKPITTRVKDGIIRFGLHTKHAILRSYLNLLLVFVPVGIAVNYAGLDPKIIFAVNAIAVVPLAGLLSHATEVVASRLGDTWGALLNVSFGNAVELIIL